MKKTRISIGLLIQMREALEEQLKLVNKIIKRWEKRVTPKDQ